MAAHPLGERPFFCPEPTIAIIRWELPNFAPVLYTSMIYQERWRDWPDEALATQDVVFTRSS